MDVEGNTATGAGDLRRRVLVFPAPLQGHINPMFHLATLLHRRGFGVTVFHAQYNAPDPSQYPDMDFIPLPVDDTPPPRPAGSLGTAMDAIEHVYAVILRCEAPFRKRLDALLGAPGAVACLVADVQLLTLIDVARRQGVPVLALHTGSAACFRSFVAYPMLCEKGYLPLPAEESQRDAPVRELPQYRVRDLMSFGGGRREHDLTCGFLSRAVTAARTSSGLIVNTFDALEAAEVASLRRELAVPVFDVGPLHKLSPVAASTSTSSLLPQDRGCLEWLDAQAPASVLYVSFGSLATMAAADLVETAWGLANSGQPFLWVLRPGLVRGGVDEAAALPEGLGDVVTRGRGMVVSWAPQEEVLAHAAVGGFWTHCGWNSTVESVAAGVPMLCHPSFADQMGNARYVEHVWRAGLTLDGELERGKVEAAIRRLMQHSDGDEMRKRAGELKAKAAAERMAREDGSSGVSIDTMVNHILSL